VHSPVLTTAKICGLLLAPAYLSQKLDLNMTN
jgi:hypothetical protein